MAAPVGLYPMPSPPIITPASRLAMGGGISRLVANADPATGASPWSDAADTILAFPFVLEAPTTFYKVFWVNGSNAGGTADVAIFDDEYTFIVGTGAATSCTGNSVPQVVALTATTALPPGRYYAGMSKNDTTINRVFRWSVATVGIPLWMSAGCWKATDAPAINSGTKTPADLTNIAFPLFGLITRSVFDV